MTARLANRSLTVPSNQSIRAHLSLHSIELTVTNLTLLDEMLQCGSNVAFALEVNSARNVVVRRNTLRYGCTAYGFGSTTGLVFEHL